MKKVRVLAAIKRLYPHLSNQNIKQFLLDQKVRVQGRVAKPHDWVDDGVEMVLPEEYQRQVLVPNPEVPCSLIKKTRDYLFFNKASGVHSVAHSLAETNTAANWLVAVDPANAALVSPLEAGLLHRLDHDTSGVMVAARNPEARDHFKALLKQEQVTKIYTCLVSKAPPACGEYTAYATSRSASSPKIKVSDKCSKGAHPLKTIIMRCRKRGHLYSVTVRLVTGFRHQIRAHLAFLGCPIVGDALYGGEHSGRLMLNATEIGFLNRAEQPVKAVFEPHW